MPVTCTQLPHFRQRGKNAYFRSSPASSLVMDCIILIDNLQGDRPDTLYCPFSNARMGFRSLSPHIRHIHGSVRCGKSLRFLQRCISWCRRLTIIRRAIPLPVSRYRKRASALSFHLYADAAMPHAHGARICDGAFAPIAICSFRHYSRMCPYNRRKNQTGLSRRYVPRSTIFPIFTVLVDHKLAGTTLNAVL